MTSVGVHEAKTHLSRLLARVEAGEEITIERRGVAVARLVPPPPPARKRVFGTAAGTIVIHDDFDELPEEFLDHFR